MERLKRKDLLDICDALWKENPISENGRWSFWKADVKNIDDMLGKTINCITLPNEDEFQDYILFECTDGSAYLMYHEQDCCESVEIEDINGDLDKLIGYPLLLADEANSCENENVDMGPKDSNYDESHTWTFYRFGTIRGFVDIRWYGESNGYYSESVDFIKLK